MPSRCDKATEAGDSTGHIEGDLVECVECYRWLCTACVRDDGPQVCRSCPEVSRRQGNYAGLSLVNPRGNAKGKGKGKGKGMGKGKVTQEVVQELFERAGRLTAGTCSSINGASSTGGSSSCGGSGGGSSLNS